MDKTKLLFVCLGNICRSPSAEGVMKAIVEKHGLAHRFEIDSAGTSGYHAGDAADARMRRHARNRGLELTSISRQVQLRDFDYFDWIIAMDDSNYNDLLSLTRSDAHRKKVVKMTDFCSLPDVDHVPDPYYGGDAGFERVLDILEDACAGFLQSLRHA
jgi:protein-tyrosine phosphatase